MSEYEAGKDVNDLLKRIERLESMFGGENNQTIITSVEFTKLGTSKKTITGYVNGEARELPYVHGENDVATWGWVYSGSGTASNTFILHVEGIPGDGPAVGCISEWNPAANGPMIGNASFYLLDVNRGINAIRVRGKHSYGGTHLPCGLGFIAFKSRDLSIIDTK